MREFVKAAWSYTLSMSLLGVQEMINIVTPQGQRPTHPATDALNKVTDAATEQMGDILMSAFRVTDNFQRGVTDATFSILTLGGTLNRNSNASGVASNAGAAAADATRDAAAGFGQQTADAMRQGFRAAGQTADVISQAVGGQQTRPPGGAQPASTDWEAVPSSREARR